MINVTPVCCSHNNLATVIFILNEDKVAKEGQNNPFRISDPKTHKHNMLFSVDTVHSTNIQKLNIKIWCNNQKEVSNTRYVGNLKLCQGISITFFTCQPL